MIEVRLPRNDSHEGFRVTQAREKTQLRDWRKNVVVSTSVPEKENFVPLSHVSVKAPEQTGVGLTWDQLPVPYDQQQRIKAWVEKIEKQGTDAIRFQQIGSGAESTIFSLAVSSGEKFVIKLFNKTLQRLTTTVAQGQANALEKINEKNLPGPVKLKKTYEQGDSFIVIEHLEGTQIDDLFAEISTNGRLDGAGARKQKISIATQLLEMLKGCYEAGVLEKDIKLDNLILQQDGILRGFDFGVVLTDDDPHNTFEQQKERFVIDLGRLLTNILGITSPFTLVIDESAALSDVTKSVAENVRAQGLPKKLADLLVKLIPRTKRSYLPASLEETVDKEPLSVINKFLQIFKNETRTNGFAVYVQKGEERKINILLSTPADNDTAKDRQLRLSRVSFLYRQASSVFPERKLPKNPTAQNYLEMDSFINGVFVTLTGQKPGVTQAKNYSLLDKADLGDDSDHFGRNYAKYIAAYQEIETGNQQNMPLDERNIIRNQALWMTFLVANEVIDRTTRARWYSKTG